MTAVTPAEKEAYAVLCSAIRACGGTPPPFEEWRVSAAYVAAMIAVVRRIA